MGGRQQSSIDLLPEEIRSQLQDLLNDRRVTQLQAVERINAILASMRDAGKLPEYAPDRLSKSAVNRYALRMEEVGAKLRQSREVAEVFISKVGAAPQGQVGLLINEMLRSMAFDLSLKLQDADLEDPEKMSATIDQVKALALAVQRLEQGASINVKRETEIRKRALEAAAEKVGDAAIQRGLTKEDAQFWREQVLGIR
ncbi:MAG: DUF3486 family protein [Pedobacter sp.]